MKASTKRERRGAAPAPRAGHDLYPLGTVSRLTQLSADLIRVWERRYRVVRPARGPRGARLYTAADVTHLRLLGRVVASGRVIGDVVGLDRASLEALLERGAAPALRPPARHIDTDGAIEAILDAASRLDATAVDAALSQSLVGLGLRAFVRDVGAPLCTRAGERWEAGRLSVAGEHLVSAALRSVLSSLLRIRAGGAGARVLLATPEGEGHEFGLLLAALTALDAGFTVVFLGAGSPPAEIASAAAGTRVAAVGISLVDSGNRRYATRQIRILLRALPPHVELWLGGRDAAAVAKTLGTTSARVVDSLDALDATLARIGETSMPLESSE